MNGTLIEQWQRIPIVCTIGASKSHESFDDLPILGWRDVRPIKGARPFDQFCGAPVQGDSMIADNIFDGDYAIFRTTFDAEEVTPGKLCAIWTPRGLVIKHVYITLDDSIRLVSSNPHYQDIVYSLEDVVIQGIVVRVEHDWD